VQSDYAAAYVVWPICDIILLLNIYPTLFVARGVRCHASG
jgi:hypothetical protein